MTTIESDKQNNCILHWTGGVSSANAPKAITANGNVTQLLPFSGAGIAMFDGTGDYLSSSYSSDWNLGSSDFTIEWWSNLSSYNAGVGRNVMSCRPSSPGGWVVSCANSANKISFTGKVGGTWGGHIEVAYPSIGVWHHIAITRSGNLWTIWINGVSSITATISGVVDNLSQPLIIGNGCSSPTYMEGYYAGSLSELRISNIARYTATFTPPKHQLQSDANTKLLLHFNTTGTTFIDSSPSNHTITAYGDAKQLCSPCGSGVAYFDGSGDYLTTPQTTDLDITMGVPFTLEFYVRKSTSTTRQIYIKRSGTTADWLVTTGNYWLMDEWDGTTYFMWNAAGSYESVSYAGVVAADNQWHHIAVAYDGFVVRLYTDFTYRGKTTPTTFAKPSTLTTNICIGVDVQTSTYYFNGFLSEFVFLKGICKYTSESAITVTTTPFKPDSYTKLLLHFDGVGQAFYDSSDPPGDNGFPILPDGVTITPNGTWATRKIQTGQTVWVFDGSTNYLTLSDNAGLTLSGNFTICWWAYPTYSGNNIFLCSVTGTSPTYYRICMVTNSGAISLIGGANDSTAVDFTGFTLTLNTWVHIALVRIGTTVYAYQNGVLIDSDTYSNILATVGGYYIGRYHSNTSYNTYGNIKDLMIFRKALTLDQIAKIMQETYIY